MADEKPTKPNCYKCKWRGKVPGSAHSRCEHPIVNSLKVEGHERGIRGGWFHHPYNFDPVWLVSCDGFNAKEPATEDAE